jgi:hypothetical protein
VAERAVQVADASDAGDATALAGIDSPGLAPVQRDNSLSFGPARAVIDIAQVRPAAAALLERRFALDQPAQAADLTLTSFSAMARVSGNGAQEFQRALRSPEFVGELDRLRDDIRREFDLDKTVSVSVAGVSLGASVAYVLWLIRGGVLMGSYLSALPAWRILDPLPVLSRVDDEAPDEDDALDAMAEQPGDPLRGF